MRLFHHIVIYTIVFVGLLFCQASYAQDSIVTPQKRYVKQTFRNTRFINVPTVKGQSKGGFEFNITHRFGLINYDENVIKDFFGLDLSSNIRIGFVVPLTKNLYVGVGRTKFQKTYDFEANYILMRQTRSWNQPVTVALYHNTAYSTDDFPPVNEDMYTSDSNLFKYKNLHRFSFYTQLSIASKLNRSISVQIAPAFTYRNLVSPNENNYLLSLPSGIRLKTTLFTSLLFEVSPVISKQPKDFFTPMAMSFEVKTVSHVFQIVLSNYNSILNQQMYYSKAKNPFNEGIYLGFNLHKFFYTKKK